MRILGAVKRKPSERHTDWNLLVPILSTVFSTRGGFLCCCTNGLHLCQEHVHPYSVLQVALTSRQMKIDIMGTSCCGKSKQNISLAVSFLLSVWLNSLSWVFKPHLPAPTLTGLPWWLGYIIYIASCSFPVANFFCCSTSCFIPSIK